MITESIFDGSTVIIPLAEVAFVRKQMFQGSLQGYLITMKNDTVCSVDEAEGKDLLAAWCRYRFQVEGVDVRP